MNNQRILMVIALMLITRLLSAQNGSIDSSFGTSGAAHIVPFPNDQYSIAEAYSIAIVKGKIIAAGMSFTNGSLYESLVQLKSNGTLDTKKFGEGGIVNYLPGFLGDTLDQYSSMAVQNDGKIVVACNLHMANAFDGWVFRFNTDGSLDPTISGTGMIHVYIPTEPEKYLPHITNLLIQTDGKFVVTGYYHTSNSTISPFSVRFNTNGNPDATFGDANGFAYLSMYSGFYPTKVIQQKDGKLVYGGMEGYNSSAFYVMRLNTNGTPDNTFANGGATEIFNADEECAVVSMVLHGTKILVCGLNTTVDGTSHFAFMDFKKDGTLNSGFNNSGKLLLNYTYGVAADVKVQKDGKFVAAGAQNYPGNPQGVVVRLNENGTADAGFGLNGVVVTDSLHGTLFYAVDIDKDGNIVAAGDAPTSSPNLYSQMVVTRFIANLGLRMSDFSPNDEDSTTASALLIYPNPLKSDANFSYELEKDEPVNISVFDLNGKLLQRVVQNEQQSSGRHTELIHFNNELPAGNYLIMIQTATKKAAVQISKE